MTRARLQANLEFEGTKYLWCARFQGWNYEVKYEC